MLFACLIYLDEKAFESVPPEEARKMSAPYNAYAMAMREAGIMVGGERLMPTTTASTVRVRDGKTEVLDGPYADTKEQFAGFFIVEVADLDAALDWAARCPGASVGAVEVRPVNVMQPS
jgi:hypothetical protein